MAELRRASPLAGATWGADGLALAALAYRGKFLLLGRPDAAAAARIAAVLGQDLPQRVGTIAGTDPAVTLLAPARWLVMIGAATAAGLQNAVATGPLALHDVGDASVDLAVAGPLASELLACATSLDLRDRCFPIGAIAQTSFAHIQGLIHRTGDQNFVVTIETSCADYAWLWLTTRARLVAACAARSSGGG